MAHTRYSIYAVVRNKVSNLSVSDKQFFICVVTWPIHRVGTWLFSKWL